MTSTRSITSHNLAIPKKALAIGAHPDDIELNAGATLAKWAASGSEIHLLICTDGSKGTWDPQTDLADLIYQRQVEQKEAARRLGINSPIIFMGWVDGELDSGALQRKQIAAHIRQIKPNIVLGHDPWKRWRLHPDHRHAGWLTTDAIVAARDPHFFSELNLPPHRPEALLLFEADEPDHGEDASGYEATKAQALQAFGTQYETTLNLPLKPTKHDLDAFQQRIAQQLANQGAVANLASAELFKLITPL